MRWRQKYDKATGKSEFVPIDDAARRQADMGHAVHGDIEAFVSPVDGSVISDRKGLREHNKRNNVVNAAEFSPEHYEKAAKERARVYTGEKTSEEKQRRGEEINNIINHLQQQG